MTYGFGVLRGLGVTLKHFVNTYVDDVRYLGRKYVGQDKFEARQGVNAQGAYTVQYPDEKIAVPERFRFVPFLVVNDSDHPTDPGKDWCTSCGICAKVCPPQCIWIVRSTDPATGRPVPEPEAFFIDIDICMNCGFCAEFCPFDAIKMDHDYEMASFDRTAAHIHDKATLSKPMSYWKSIAPTTAFEEMQARGGWEHKDAQKAERTGGKSSRGSAKAEAPAKAAAPAAAAPVTEKAAPSPAAKTPPPANESRAERLARKREEAKAKKAAEGGE